MFYNIVHFLAVLLTAICLPLVASAQTLLVMLERDDCPWCRAWHREIGPGYPHSDEGKRAPLRRVDLARPWPGDLPRLPVFYTPTFVLLSCGKEVGRLVGYQGEHFFYPAVAQLLSGEAGNAAC
jgi:hypothetical protein